MLFQCPAEPSTTSATTTQVNKVTTSKYMNKTTDQTRPSPTEVQTEENETTRSQGPQKTTELTISPTTAGKTVNSSEKTNENQATPTKESLKTIHTNTTNNVTVMATQKPSTRPTKKNDSTEAKSNEGPLNIQGNHGGRSGSRSSAISNVGVGLIILSLVIILVALCWFVYAYRHPQSRSGRFLIEVRRNPDLLTACSYIGTTNLK